MDSPDTRPYPGDIDLRKVAATVWRERKLVGLITAAGGALALTYALLATEFFRSEAVVQPREDAKGGGGLATVVSQFGGLADLAGFSMGGSGDRAVAVATLRSRAMIEAFIIDLNLMPKLYPSKWDAEAGQWKNPDRAPTVWEAYNDFTDEVMRVSEDKKTGLVIVAVEWRDPVEARQWVMELIARTNGHLKAKAIKEGEANLAYLEEQSRRIGQVELQRSLYGLMESELKKLMLAKGSDEFALKTIDPATVPTKKERPRRALIVVLGVVFGGFVGVLVALLRAGASRAR